MAAPALIAEALSVGEEREEAIFSKAPEDGKASVVVGLAGWLADDGQGDGAGWLAVLERHDETGEVVDDGKE